MAGIRKAIEYYEQSLVIAREIGDRHGEGAALGNLGNVYYALGDAGKAIEFHEQALVIAREIGDRHGEGAALCNLGNARKAIEYYEQALVIAREIGDRRGEGNALGGLGIAYYARGDASKAINLCLQQLVITREIGDRHGEGAALGNLGNAHFDLGDVRQAIEYHEQALVISREIGNRQAEGNALWNLALMLEKLGDLLLAFEYAQQSHSIRTAMEDPDSKKVAEWLTRHQAEYESKKADSTRHLAHAHQIESHRELIQAVIAVSRGEHAGLETAQARMTVLKKTPATREFAEALEAILFKGTRLEKRLTAYLDDKQQIEAVREILHQLESHNNA